MTSASTNPFSKLLAGKPKSKFSIRIDTSLAPAGGTIFLMVQKKKNTIKPKVYFGHPDVFFSHQEGPWTSADPVRDQY